MESLKWRNGCCLHLRTPHHEVRLYSGIYLETQLKKDQKCTSLPYIDIDFSTLFAAVGETVQ